MTFEPRDITPKLRDDWRFFLFVDCQIAAHGEYSEIRRMARYDHTTERWKVTNRVGQLDSSNYSSLEDPPALPAIDACMAGRCGQCGLRKEPR